jgi:hypothetical protein
LDAERFVEEVLEAGLRALLDERRVAGWFRTYCPLGRLDGMEVQTPDGSVFHVRVHRQPEPL